VNRKLLFEDKFKVLPLTSGEDLGGADDKELSKNCMAKLMEE
jgi:hypothetical protein